MLINSQTKISVLIKHNMEAIDVIASINPHFKKLKNPILRALLAPRVNIAEASKIGKCSIDVMFEKLKSIGFSIDTNEKDTQEEINLTNVNKEIIPTKSIDVRPIIKKGEDPFLIILNAAKNLKKDETLEVINSFEPIPLIRIFRQKGFICSTIQKEENLFSSFFQKTDVKLNFELPKLVKELEEKEFIYEDNATKDNQIELDVRDLEMPLPMLTILENLEHLPQQKVLKVFHKKVPQFLIPELERRAYYMQYYVKSEDEVIILISK